MVAQQRHRRRQVVAALSAATAAPFALAGCIVTSPNPSAHAGFSAVAALTKSDAWAVGSWSNGTGAHDLIERWDGKGWKIAPLPTGGTGLSDVTAIDATNVWAVGGHRTLHWSGVAWRLFPSPAGLLLTDVASSPSGALLAVGYTTGQQPTVLRWTPAGWHVMAGPVRPSSHRTCDGGNLGLHLAVVNASDIWAVGDVSGTGSNASVSCAYTAHWNGATWQSVATPALPDSVELSAASARSSHDVWAVGTSRSSDPDTGRLFEHGVALHWDGVSWRALSNVDTTGWGDSFNDIDATAAGVWAVGHRELFGGSETDMVIKRWSGTAFLDQTVQRIATSGTQSAELNLNGVAVGDGVVVSVGGYSPSINVDATLVDRRNAI